MPFLTGLQTGLALIMAIGAQNAFVLRQGIRREHVFVVCFICALSDAILIALGVGGLGAISGVAPWLLPLMRWGGVAFLLAYGARAFWAAWKGGAALEAEGAAETKLSKIVLTVVALTWLNPHVYLDTVVLLGSIAAQFGPARWEFALGGMTGSFLFFFTLGYGARLLAPVFAKPVSWRVLDILVGLVMWSIAFKLALG